MARTCSGAEHATSGLVLEAAGSRLSSDAAAGRAWHQVSSDPEGPCRFRFRDGERRRNVVSLVHEVILRQAMADRGWRAPQFVLQAGPGRRAGCLEPVWLPAPRWRFEAGDGEAIPVFHCAAAGVEPAPAGRLAGGGGALPIADKLLRSAGLRASGRTGWSREVAADVRASERLRWSRVAALWAPAEIGLSAWLRKFMAELAGSYPVTVEAASWALVRKAASLGGVRSAGGVRAGLAGCYWAAVGRLSEACGLTVVREPGDRVLWEPVTRTLIPVEVPGSGERTAAGALFEAALVSGRPAWAEMARRRDVVGLLRELGLGGVLARPVDFSGPAWAVRARVVAAFAAKRLSELCSVRYESARDVEVDVGLRALTEREGWASVVTEAGNLATWLVDGVAGRRGGVVAAGDAGA